ncbi:hypothetical protein ACFQQB_42900 [Nonomuraea rubra]|uniref:hypothetical protein n=1 Tax=Nonomuraea rubra TaxID=46180 RepID=UPI00361B72D0
MIVGETPAACTRPSQAYLKESVLLLGGAASPVAASTIPPATTSGPSRRSGTRRATQTADANSAHAVRYQPSPEGSVTVLTRTAARAARIPPTASWYRLTGGSLARRSPAGTAAATAVRGP